MIDHAPDELLDFLCQALSLGQLRKLPAQALALQRLAPAVRRDEVRYLSHILTRQPLGWPTVECSRFN